MKRSNWVRLIAVILIISMLAAPVSAATIRGNDGVRTNGVVGIIVDFIRDIIRDIFDDWFDEPGEEEPTPTTPVNPTTPTPTQPGETEPEETDPTEPGETKPTQPGETEPEETDPTEPGETEPEEDEDKPETTLNLVEGYENTKNGHLLRGHTYTLSQVIAQQNSKPATTTTANRFGTKLGNGLGGNSISTGLKPMGGLSVMAADAEITISDTALVITYDENGNAVIENGQYALGIVGGKYVTNVSANSDWGDTLSGTSSKDSATIWTITRQADGSYTVQDSNNEYLSVPGWNYATMSATPVYISIHQDGSNTVLKQLNTVDEYCYLNALGSITSSSFGGWNEGTPICLYSVTTTEPEQPTPDPDPEMPDMGMVEVIPFSKLTWEQVKNGKVTYYLNDRCTNPVKVVEKNNGASYELVDSEGNVEATLNSNDLSQRIGVQLYTPSYIVFFPVTMFDYDQPTINNATHALEAAANPALTEWQGIYFNGGTPDSITYGDTLNNWVDGGTYYIQSARANNYNAPSWMVGSTTSITSTDNQDDATLWTLQINDDNTCYLSTVQDGTTYYMYIGSGKNGEMLSTTPTKLTITNFSVNDGHVVDDGNLLQIAGSSYLCQWGGTTVSEFGGHTAGDSGNAMWFYLVDGENQTKVTAGDGIHADFAKWNFWAKKTDNNANGDLFYTGLVQPELVNDEIVFTVPDGGIFNKDENVKDIYEFVGMPFILNSESGVYSFDSDYHGAYFSGDPQSGTENAPHNLHFALEAPQPMPTDESVGDGSTNAFLPYNNQSSYSKKDVNYHFGMRADLPFSMTSNGRIKETDDNSTPITFTFSGDDDVWIFIDGKLVADLGGIHNRLDITLDFAANTITYFEENSQDDNKNTSSYNDTTFATTQKLFNDTDGDGLLGMTRPEFASNENHELQFFYLERGEGTSNCHIEFNLPMRDTILVTKDITKSWSQKQDEDDGDRDGTAPLTSKEQAAVNKLDFYFKLWKKEAGGEFQVVANTNFILQDQDDNFLGIQSTGPDGKFSLKNQQTAKFMTEIPRTGVTYYVEEIDLDHETFLTPDYNYKGETTYGMNYEGDYLDPTEDDENHTSHVKKFTTDASLIPEHELPMDAEVLKSYDFTPMGSIESRDYLEFICTNYLNAELPSPTARAYEDIIVIDYGLPVQIDPLHNDLFRGEDIEIVAWGDETLTLSEELDEHGFAIDAETTWRGNKVLAAAYVSNGTTYSSTPVNMADCLYTFKKNADGTYEIFSTTADGTKVYLNHYTSDTNEIPNDSIPSRIKIENGANQNMFKLIAQVMEGGTGVARTLHFHSEQTMPYWNRCGNDTSFKCQEYLYRPAGKDDVSSTEIPGYVMVTSLDEIKDGGQYLIVHDKDYNSTDDDLFVLHPSTSNSQWDHVAKVGTTTSPAIGTSFSFDSGNVTFKDKTYAEYEHKNEKNETYYTYDRDTFEYELTKQLTEVEEIHYIIKVTSTTTGEVTGQVRTASRYAEGVIYIVPATIMYYEENFSDMITFTGSNWVGEIETAGHSDYQEPGVVGTHDDSTYGSDVAYLNDSRDSNGTSYYGDTSGIASNSGKAGAMQFSYTFTGTGTTFFARTSAKTGYMRVQVYSIVDNVETLVSTTYRDTYWKDKNENALDTDGVLYNIPVFTEEFQHYGTYKVVCTIAKSGGYTTGNPDGAGNEFYLDGIRIMQPLNESADATLTQKALDAYATDGESNLDVVTLRQKLITDYHHLVPVEDGEDNTKEEDWPFAVLTDIEGNIIKASDYISIGPKEEVYLSANTFTSSVSNAQKVSFSLKYWQPDGLKIYMGMKAPFGSATVNVGHDIYQLNNTVDCYYDITDNRESLVTMYEQLRNSSGQALFTDPTDREVYLTDNGEYFYSEDGNPVPDGTELLPKDDLNKPYYVVTYTFEAANSIVSLTNIKVVGQYQFTILGNKNIQTTGYELEVDYDPTER